MAPAAHGAISAVPGAGDGATAALQGRIGPSSMSQSVTAAPPGSAAAAHHGSPAAGSPAASPFWALTLGSIGVVYGDIGTSPLYAFREAVTAASAGGPLTRAAVVGVVS